jgi:hypothetical protein
MSASISRRCSTRCWRARPTTSPRLRTSGRGITTRRLGCLARRNGFPEGDFSQSLGLPQRSAGDPRSTSRGVGFQPARPDTATKPEAGWGLVATRTSRSSHRPSSPRTQGPWGRARLRELDRKSRPKTSVGSASGLSCEENQRIAPRGSRFVDCNCSTDKPGGSSPRPD